MLSLTFKQKGLHFPNRVTKRLGDNGSEAKDTWQVSKIKVSKLRTIDNATSGRINQLWIGSFSTFIGQFISEFESYSPTNQMDSYHMHNIEIWKEKKGANFPIFPETCKRFECNSYMGVNLWWNTVMAANNSNFFALSSPQKTNYEKIEREWKKKSRVRWLILLSIP